MADNGVWWYCIHCFRCWRQDADSPFKAGIPDEDTTTALGPINDKGDPWLKCPYDGCDGDPKDFWRWDKHRESFSEELPAPYPETPLVGVVYPMYPAAPRV